MPEIRPGTGSDITMSMYISSVSLMDRGDGPAQAVIDRNARSLAQRIADDTKQELEKVLGRVDNVVGSYEMTTDIYGSSNLEYVNDLSELAELLKDQVKKKKYQQQVTIFVVGFQDVCGQRLTLLKQVNEFFMENSKSIEDEDWFPKTPDLDLDDVQDSIEESLDTAYTLTRRLGELNREIVDYLATYAEKKASSKGKKKLEKLLQQTKDEVFSLQEKLLNLQTEVEEKEDKMQALFRQLESKTFEIQRFRTAAEVAKSPHCMVHAKKT
ncbi:uncharacterized protein LOC121373472 [Gigantopelta aegis]|uniref:uncharacterized protein LOC121373472 n=1 Tax=Gigantopelta aegis TaxID=1735272 RepID=UPI001B887983|nr:uncharacterized protein LOC121373472 [Gigantopelta aegis]